MRVDFCECNYRLPLPRAKVSPVFHHLQVLDDKPGSTTVAAAEHIAVQASHLARLASANHLPLLAYLIDMAVLEAWREASERDDGGEAESDEAAVAEAVAELHSFDQRAETR